MTHTESTHIKGLSKETNAQRIYATAIKEAVSSREAIELEIENLRSRLKAKEEAVAYFKNELQVAMTVADNGEHEKATATVHGAKRIFNRIVGGGF
jgi:regulator of replication initiation timing